MHNQFKKPFQNYLEILDQREHHNKKLGWLFNEYPNNFFPDYLTFGSFGPTHTQHFLNRAASATSPKLWQYMAWPKILKTIHRRFLVPYAEFMIDHAEKADPGRHDRDLQKQAYIQALMHNLESAPPLIRTSSFSDFFYFTSKTLQIWSNNHDLHLDCFAHQKKQHLLACHNMYKTIHDDVYQHPKRLQIILLLCARANWIDCSEEKVDEFLNIFLADIESFFEDEESLAFFEHEYPFFDITPFEQFLAQKPRTIMYEMDNCGECFFDFLLIEWLLEHGHTVKMAVKHEPFLNDVTHQDIYNILDHFQLSSMKKWMVNEHLVIVNSGASVAGKYVYDVSRGYKNHLKTCDLQILKGQGHFQTTPIGRATQKLVGKQKVKKGSFEPFKYKHALFFIMGVKADLIDYSLQTMFTNSPERHSMFVYFYNPADPSTYPT